MHLPDVLQDPDDGSAVAVIEKYYGLNGNHPDGYTGARFDTWDSTGTRSQDANRFTADDLVAVTMLSVEVPARAAIRLLDRDRQRFNSLLAQVGPDRDLVDEEALADDWVGWELMQALKDLPGVGPTTASKLFARKRPRLRSIYDTVVAQVTGTVEHQWEPMRRELRANDRQLHERLVAIRAKAGLDLHADYISAIRILDVLCWMQGKS